MPKSEHEWRYGCAPERVPLSEWGGTCSHLVGKAGSKHVVEGGIKGEGGMMKLLSRESQKACTLGQ